MGVVESFVAAGTVTAVLAAFITLVRLALRSEGRRADDWRTSYQTAMVANGVMSTNMDKLVATVEQLATAQREMMSLLQTVATERRGAA